jgi:NTP pyrophosphatase (non-canonical NTP hydrolase)
MNRRRRMTEWQRLYDKDQDTRTFLTFLQQESQKWREANFPPEHRNGPMQALGVAEEAGELAHGVLKLEQGIRGDRKEHLAEIRDACGDLVIYLSGIAASYGFNLHAAVYEAWLQVSLRNWQENRETGIVDERQSGASGL